VGQNEPPDKPATWDWEGGFSKAQLSGRKWKIQLVFKMTVATPPLPPRAARQSAGWISPPLRAESDSSLNKGGAD